LLNINTFAVELVKVANIKDNVGGIYKVPQKLVRGSDFH